MFASTAVGADDPMRDKCGASYTELFFATQNGHFYVAMGEWGPREWYQKSLAKAYQARLMGVERSVEAVPLDDIGFLHPIDPKFGNGRTFGQTLERARLIDQFLKANPGFQGITEGFQRDSQLSRDLSAAAESQVKLSTGFRLPDGKVVLIDGNGRLAAWHIAAAGRPEGSKPLSMDINVIDWKDAPPGTAELIAHARRARGGEGWNPLKPHEVNATVPERIRVGGKEVELSEQSALEAYYAALADLLEAEQAGQFQRPRETSLFDSVPATGTDTWRHQEGTYRVPPDMIRLAKDEAGKLVRFSNEGKPLEGEAAKLSVQDLEVGEKYIFVVDSTGAFRLARERGQEGARRDRKHGDLVPSELRPDIAEAVQKRAAELEGSPQSDRTKRTRDEAFQDALAEALFNEPGNREAFRRTYREAFRDIADSVRKAGLDLPEKTIARKARLRALHAHGLLKEPLGRVYVPAKEGSVRGLARIGGGFKVQSDGKGGLLLFPTLNSSYAFARLDGVYHDTPANLRAVKAALGEVVGPHVAIGP